MFTGAQSWNLNVLEEASSEIGCCYQPNAEQKNPDCVRKPFHFT